MPNAAFNPPLKWTMNVVLLVSSSLVLAPLLYATPLDDYVNRPDPVYKYEIIEQVKGLGYTRYTVNMTSQTWMPISDWHSRPVWYHTLTIVVPDNILYTDTGFLYISGDNNPNGIPSSTDEFVWTITMLAIGTGTITANLKQVPNQPIIFKDDPEQRERREDSIIAWTWKTFMEQNGSNPEVLLRMPMTKAAVRALDTVSDLAKTTAGHAVNRFVVAGESKRGWTTWTVGAVDSRVIAICPIVMDLLNFTENLHHYFRSLGGWTWAFYDYYSVNFTSYMDDPALAKMMAIIDPISYTDRYANVSKYIISSTGDEFFMVDDPRFYIQNLKGPTYFRQIANVDHGMDGQRIDLTFALRAFYLSTLTGTDLPKMNWTKTYTRTGGRLTVVTDTPPTKIYCFYTTTLDPKRKDFREYVLSPGNSRPVKQPVHWFVGIVQSLGKNTYSVEFDNPRNGWSAFFIQVTFPGLMGSALEFTTETMVIPDTYPFPDCKGTGCRGVLVR